jgi:methyl-accepting chemotaxis protein
MVKVEMNQVFRDIKKRVFGIKFYLILSILLSFFCLFFTTFFFVFYFSEQKNASNYFLSVFLILLILEYALYSYLKKLEKKSFLAQSLLQGYVQKIQITSLDFDYPIQNIEKSFDKQFDLMNQTAAAIFQISQMILKTTEQIYGCQEIVKTAEKILQEGSAVMGELGKSIDVIKSATIDMDKMLAIINQITVKSLVITDIVSKTDLLAMNASIEAARAGDYGKGFSVVSEEVENLARVSGKSAKQIKNLLNDSSIKISQIIRTMNDRIKEGEEISKKAIQAYENINEGVAQLKLQIHFIAESTETQKDIMKNVSDLLGKVTNVIHENNKILHQGHDSNNNLMKLNNLLFQCSEESLYIIAGIQAALAMEKTRHNEALRALQKIGF